MCTAQREHGQIRTGAGRVRVLVTGHHGYLGSLVTPALLERGHEVVGLDAFLYRGCDLFHADPKVERLELDVRDVTAAHFEGFEAIVHLAALSNDPLGEVDPRLTAEINFEATLVVARAAKQAGVRRFVFASSCSMYGAADEDTDTTEEAPLRPLTAYAESKARSEEALMQLADDSFSPVFLRNATAYGVSPRLRLDVVLNNLVAWGFTTGRITLMSDGTPWRPIVHVQDIARCVARVLEAPTEAVHNEAFNVGSNSENYQVRDLAEIVHDAIPGCTIGYADGAGPDPRSYRVDFSKLADAFPDLEFQWTAPAGALELLESYRAAGLTSAQLHGHKYTRLKHIKFLLETGALNDELRWINA
jgi:nucleoside-diphosphate-sugar epimerase